MLFSCKISSAILTFLDREGEDVQALLDASHLPEEFLRDPSFWIKASEMEDFLQVVTQMSRFEIQILSKVGHSGPELKSWGVLDSVLKMMPRPHEIFNQPQRFLSYFISPEPPLENIRNSESGIQLDLPVSSEMFPLVTTYLRHAFEALPLYIGQDMATCEWNDIHLKIKWADAQKTIFSEDPGRQISPELLRSIVASLEKYQRELEAKNRELQDKNEQLQRAQEETRRQVRMSRNSLPEMQPLFEQTVSHFEAIENTSAQILKSNFSKLADYMVRAQQLVTLLVGQDRLKPSIKEAMRRTDWETIKIQFPQTVKQSLDILKQTQKLETSEERVNGDEQNLQSSSRPFESAHSVVEPSSSSNSQNKNETNIDISESHLQTEFNLNNN